MKNKLSNIRTAFVVIAASLLLSLTACEKKDNNSAAVNPYGTYGQGCSNCFPNPVPAIQGMRSFTYYSEGVFTLDLLVNQMPQQGYGYGYPMNWQDPLMLNYYSGPAALQGFLDVQTQDATFCYIAPGRYTVNTVQAGMLSSKIVSGVQLDVNGPGGRMIMSVMTGIIMGQFDYSGPKIAMTLRLDSVNGYPCGVLQTSQY